MYIQIYLHTYTHIYICIYIHIYIDIHIYMCIHISETPTSPLSSKVLSLVPPVLLSVHTPKWSKPHLEVV